MRSLEFGLGLRKPGYNVFVTGMTGTGKAGAILEYVRREVGKLSGQAELRDWCYVFNFDEPDRPNALNRWSPSRSPAASTRWSRG